MKLITRTIIDLRKPAEPSLDEVFEELRKFGGEIVLSKRLLFWSCRTNIKGEIVTSDLSKSATEAAQSLLKKIKE